VRIDDYFITGSREALASYLFNLGATISESLSYKDAKRFPAIIVRFSAGKWFFDSLVLFQDGPRYSPRVKIGVIPKISDVEAFATIDVMHFVPEEDSMRNYNLERRYGTKDGLLKALTDVRDKILKPYVEPVLNEPNRLRQMILDKNKKLRLQGEDEIQGHNAAILKRQADAAFSSQDYRHFLELVAKVPVRFLSASDFKKVEIAEKRTL